MTSSSQRIVVKVYPSSTHRFPLWVVPGVVLSSTPDELVIGVDIDRPVEEYLPLSPRRVESPIPALFVPPLSFPVIASDSEPEEEIPLLEQPTPPPCTPPRPPMAPKKRGRPRKTALRPDECWLEPRRKRKGRVVAPSPEGELECQCCCTDSELLVGCTNPTCSAHLCMKCLSTVNRRFEGLCPYCRLAF